MSTIGKRCHELRVIDKNTTWRLVYRIDTDAVLILEVFTKTTEKTPKAVTDVCKTRLSRYENEAE